MRDFARVVAIIIPESPRRQARLVARASVFPSLGNKGLPSHIYG